MGRETRERAEKHDCVFFPRERARQPSAVCCTEKVNCAKCGWNPEVHAARLKKIREGYVHE